MLQKVSCHLRSDLFVNAVSRCRRRTLGVHKFISSANHANSWYEVQILRAVWFALRLNLLTLSPDFCVNYYLIFVSSTVVDFLISWYCEAYWLYDAKQASSGFYLLTRKFLRHTRSHFCCMRSLQEFERCSFTCELILLPHLLVMFPTLRKVMIWNKSMLAPPL